MGIKKERLEAFYIKKRRKRNSHVPSFIYYNFIYKSSIAQ